jgi:hypothetical protein
MFENKLQKSSGTSSLREKISIYMDKALCD